MELREKYSPNKLLLPNLCLVIAVICLFVFLPYSANAAICKDDNGASVGSADNLSVSIVYCVKKSFHDATVGAIGSGGYLGGLKTLLAPYTYSLLTFALSLFGIKLITNGVEDLQKEGGTIIFKIAIILYLISNAENYYQSCIDAMGELISWVSNGFASITSTCSSPTLPSGADIGEYKVWQEFDCMFQALFGLSTNPNFMFSSLLVVVGAALLSGTLGVAIVPILIFESKYTTDIFWKWVGLITSTIFQPLFLIAFLSFVVSVEDAFIEGGADSTPAIMSDCNVEQSLNGKVVAQGSGICSFKQLWLGNKNVNSQSLTDVNIKDKTEIGDSGGQIITCDPQGKSNSNSSVLSSVTTGIKGALDSAGQTIASAAGFTISGYTKIRDGQLSLKQLFVTLSAFTIVSFMMRNLMNVIPQMAQHITVSVGIGLLQKAQVPMESVVASAVKGLGDSMYGNSKYKDKDGKQKTRRGLGGVKAVFNPSNIYESAKSAGSYMRKHW